MSPRFLSGEYKNWREQLAKRAEYFMHDTLSCPTTRRICRVAIHPVLGDVDIETAQIHCTKLVQHVVNLVELERFVGRTAIGDHLVQTLQNPAINQRYSR